MQFGILARAAPVEAEVLAPRGHPRAQHLVLRGRHLLARERGEALDLGVHLAREAVGAKDAQRAQVGVGQEAAGGAHEVGEPGGALLDRERARTHHLAVDRGAGDLVVVGRVVEVGVVAVAQREVDPPREHVRHHELDRVELRGAAEAHEHATLLRGGHRSAAQREQRAQAVARGQLELARLAHRAPDPDVRVPHRHVDDVAVAQQEAGAPLAREAEA